MSLIGSSGAQCLLCHVTCLSYLYVINTSITKGRALFYNFTETKCICPPSSQMLKVYFKKNCKNV